MLRKTYGTVVILGLGFIASFLLFCIFPYEVNMFKVYDYAIYNSKFTIKAYATNNNIWLYMERVNLLDETDVKFNTIGYPLDIAINNGLVKEDIREKQYFRRFFKFNKETILVFCVENLENYGTFLYNEEDWEKFYRKCPIYSELAKGYKK